MASSPGLSRRSRSEWHSAPIIRHGRDKPGHDEVGLPRVFAPVTVRRNKGITGANFLHSFANWLANTAPSIALAKSSWVVPTTQTTHIVAIAILFSSVLMVGLRVMGWAGRDQTLKATVAWFATWFWGSLVVLAVTGVILTVAEPPRQLLAISFWLKMSTLATAIAIAVLFLTSINRNAPCWEGAARPRMKVLGIVTFCVWCLVVFLGRFIAFDEQIWGRFSTLH